MSDPGNSTSSATTQASSADAAAEAANAVVPHELKVRWLAVNTIAFAFAGALCGGIMRAISEPYYGSSIPALQAGVVQALSAGASGAVFGTLIGVGQWLVLRRALAVRWWIPATAAGCSLMGLLTGFMSGGSVSDIGPDQGPVPPLVTTFIGVPAALGLLGLFQWLILRRQVDDAVWWPIGNLTGLFLGLATGFAVATSVFARTIPVLAPTDFPSAKALLVVFAVGGLLYAATTWAALGVLRRRSGSIGPTSSGT